MRGGALAGLGLRVAARQQQVAAALLVGRRLVERAQRDLVQPRRLLVREHAHRALRRLLGVVDRLRRAALRRREEEVVRELGQRRLGAVDLEALERLADAQVQPRAARLGEAVVERLPDQAVREAAAAVDARDLGDHVRRDALLDDLVELVLVVRPDGLEQLDPELAADHGGGREHLAGALGQRRQPAPDHLADALRQLERPRRAVALGLRRVAAEVADHLLEEERVALGLLPQRPVDVLGHALAGRTPRSSWWRRPRRARAARSARSSARAAAGRGCRRAPPAARCRGSSPRSAPARRRPSARSGAASAASACPPSAGRRARARRAGCGRARPAPRTRRRTAGSARPPPAVASRRTPARAPRGRARSSTARAAPATTARRTGAAPPRTAGTASASRRRSGRTGRARRRPRTRP